MFYLVETLHDEYEFLRLPFEQIDKIGYYEFSDEDNMIKQNAIKPNNVIIFDDADSCNPNIIKTYFGHNKNID